MARGKENMEQQETVTGLSEHAAKVREAREARRKRILARSSERLAFITGEANAIPTSPLLDDHKSNIALISLSSLLNQDISPDHNDSTIKKSFLFNEHEQTAAHKKPVNNIENTSQEGAAAEGQPLKDQEAMKASKEQANEVSMKENAVTFKSMFNNCIKQSLFPRLMSATCIALAFLASGFTWGGRRLATSSPATSVFAQSGHLGGSDALSMICYSLASVMLADLLLFTGAFFFMQGREHLKMVGKREATSSILLHFLLSISLDCSISASLLSGGFLLLSKVKWLSEA